MLKIGAASKVINGEIGDWIQGVGVFNRAKNIRDDLEANALYIENCEWKILLVSCDLAGMPSDIVPIHVLRIGELAIVTQPCELFCRFGLDIKRRSPAAATAIFGIADGYCGYCPTTEAIMGGGYSGVPLSWSRLSGQAGYLMVDTASGLLRKAWR